MYHLEEKLLNDCLQEVVEEGVYSGNSEWKTERTNTVSIELKQKQTQSYKERMNETGLVRVFDELIHSCFRSCRTKRTMGLWMLPPSLFTCLNQVSPCDSGVHHP